jgi:hypothetical protein
MEFFTLDRFFGSLCEDKNIQNDKIFIPHVVASPGSVTESSAASSEM